MLDGIYFMKTHRLLVNCGAIFEVDVLFERVHCYDGPIDIMMSHTHI